MQLSFQGRCSMERKIVVLAAEGVLALVLWAWAVTPAQSASQDTGISLVYFIQTETQKNCR